MPRVLLPLLAFINLASPVAAQQRPLKVLVSVDMEGVGRSR